MFKLQTTTIAFIPHAGKVMLKILQARLQQYVNWELPDVQAGFRKHSGIRDQIANIHWIIEEAREFQKNTYSASLTTLKPLTTWITTNWQILFFNSFFFFLLYNIVLVLPQISMNSLWVYTCSQFWTPSHLPPATPSQCTSPKHPVSCIEHRLVIRFLYDIIHVSMPFFQIIPPSPSPTESKRLFYTSVSLLLSRIQGYRYHLSKFHIYALVYCIGVFLSSLLHSV